jgi:hypothetical protein
MTAKQLKGLFAPDGSQYATLTDGAGNLAATGSGLTIGTSTITGGADTQVLFNNAGVVSSDAGLTKVAGSTGLVSFGGSINLPNTAAGPIGIINFAGTPFLHDAGSFDNIFLGHNAGNLSVTGTRNVILGESAGGALTSGANNIFIGRFAGGQITTTGNNVAIGTSALSSAISNANCVAVGFGSVTGSGNNNTGVGATSLSSLTTGTGNVAIGQGTGVGITTGTNNTILGAGVSGLSAGLSSAVILAANGIKADFGNTNAVTWTFAGPVRPQTYTVATLPAAPGTGAIAVITDQLTTAVAKGAAPTGGGAVVCTVIYTGASWVGI